VPFQLIAHVSAALASYTGRLRVQKSAQLGEIAFPSFSTPGQPGNKQW
jgi:hypothetical protein